MLIRLIFPYKQTPYVLEGMLHSGNLNFPCVVLFYKNGNLSHEPAYYPYENCGYGEISQDQYEAFCKGLDYKEQFDEFLKT